MATSQNLVKVSDHLSLNNGTTGVDLKAGQANVIKAKAGEHYRIILQKEGVSKLLDNVIVKREGVDLQLQYADGTQLTLSNYYNEAKGDTGCDIALPGQDGIDYIIGENNALGTELGDGTTLMYAHGDHDVLMSMAPGDTALQNTLADVSGNELSYIPGLPIMDRIAGINPWWVAIGLAAIGGGVGAGVGLSGGSTSGENTGSNDRNANQVALTAIQNAAINNTAATGGLSVATYVTAGVTGVTSSNLAAINSALDSVLVDGSKTSTTALIQSIVAGYNAILASADSLMGNTTPALTSAQYTSIGVTNAPTGNALVLLDNVIDGLATTAVSTELQVQALADAANAVMTGAAGGTAPTLAQLGLLGIRGVTAGNLVAVQQAIAATLDNGTGVNTQALLQAVATAGANAGSNAITAIQNAAINNTAATGGLSVATYVTAGVTGVTSSNLAAINSALDSVLVDGSKTSTTALIQSIVTGYNAILASADNTGGNTTTPITGEQYAAVGVTGVAKGSPTLGTALALLDSVVDASPQTAVNLVGNLQKMADASAHVMAAAGGSDADAANLSVADLQALGFIAVTSSNISTVRAAIKAVTSDGSIDSQSELAGIVNNAIHNNIAGPSPVFSPVFSTVLGGVTNLDVTSNLVLTSTRSLNVGSGFIRFTDLGGSNGGTGFHTDNTTNSFTIDVSTAVAGGLVSFDATHTKIIINPTFDLDLSSNYSISIDAGAFVDQSTGVASHALAAVNFSTVTPGIHSASGTLAGEALPSQIMDATGVLLSSKSWIDLESYNTNNINGITQIGDLSTGAYALVMKNYATAPGRANSSIPDDGGSVGIQLHDVSIGVSNFSANDQLYFDSQVNDPAVQKFAPEFLSAIQNASSFSGGIAGQNLLNFNYDPNVTPSGSSNQIALGFQGSTTIFQFIYPYPGFTDMATTLNIPAPVVMG